MFSGCAEDKHGIQVLDPPCIIPTRVDRYVAPVSLSFPIFNIGGPRHDSHWRELANTAPLPFVFKNRRWSREQRDP